MLCQRPQRSWLETFNASCGMHGSIDRGLLDGLRDSRERQRAIPGISQKMLAQQLRQLEGDGIVTRTVHAEVPPKVEYSLTKWGQSLCPASRHTPDLGRAPTRTD